MTASQKEIAEFLRKLGRPAEAIAANTGLPLDEVRSWLKSSRSLFGESLPQKVEPVTTRTSRHGLSLFAAESESK